jgi:hypothetical protein
VFLNLTLVENQCGFGSKSALRVRGILICVKEFVLLEILSYHLIVDCSPFLRQNHEKQQFLGLILEILIFNIYSNSHGKFLAWLFKKYSLNIF